MFAYSDEEDKSFGLTGMVISLNIYDQYSMLREVSMDRPDGEGIAFTPDFYFDGNPRMSAKIAWNEMVRQYQMLTGMVLGNVMCRSMVHLRKPLAQERLDAMRRIVEEEGTQSCSLEQDEIDAIFNKTYNYLERLYSNRQVATIADRFAAVLRRRRTMTGTDVEEEIETLRRAF
ncbi:MAG: hypothetical protein LUD17_00205 [Bacteroidales bacterium]|nr:hypothetical protein [Bacteroidales bacterium]MCD8385292.1 hypothetical protein [Bacteroidales bacterium]